MFKRRCFVFSILAVMFFYPLNLLPVESPGENNSNELCIKLLEEIARDPSGGPALSNAARLLELAPYTGRRKIISAFEDAIKTLTDKGYNEIINSPVFRLLTDELERNCLMGMKYFSVITKWNISGPWTRRGFPDHFYAYQPEKAVRIGDIEKGKNIFTGKDGRILPFRIIHGAGETVYLTCSFNCEEPVILWIVSDSGYRLAVNGGKITDGEISGKREIKAYSLRGAKGYSIQIKITAESSRHNPAFRVLVTDEKNAPVKLDYTDRIFSYPYTPEKLFSLAEYGAGDSGEAAVLSGEMDNAVASGNFYRAYQLGRKITGKYPSYAFAYGKFMHVLDLTGRDDEYRKTLDIFRNTFPDSDIHREWLAGFQMTRDRTEFSRIMKNPDTWDADETAIESYLYMLCGEKKHQEAITVCTSLSRCPRMRFLLPRLIRDSGDFGSWKKALLREITDRDDACYYYDLGLAEMLTGFDPVMYWAKGMSQGSNPLFLRDLSDIYENSIIEPTEYYTGSYTDYHPEFLWYSKKRRFSAYVAESGKVYFEGEDIIPSLNKVKRMKFTESGLEYSGNEIRTILPCIRGLRVLYVLTARGGLASVTGFTTEISGNCGVTVKYNTSGKEEFSVVKYSGEYTGNKRNIFMLAEDIVLKSEAEKMSDLEYEVIYTGNFSPVVNYQGVSLVPGKTADGSIRFVKKDKFSDDDNNRVVSDILRFSSEGDFAAWYREIITSMGGYNNVKLNISGDADTEDIIKKIYLRVMTQVSKTGEINFHPARPDVVLTQGKGTVEERTLIAKTIFDSKGIKSFVSFIRDKNGNPEKILLYIPEKKGEGLWLNFYGDSSFTESAAENDAIVLTADGYKMIPVKSGIFIK